MSVVYKYVHFISSLGNTGKCISSLLLSALTRSGIGALAVHLNSVIRGSKAE